MMRVFYGFEHRFHKAVVAVGSFDGVHRGHRLLIEQMNAKALAIGGEAVVVTFDPHPRWVLRGENRLLTTLEEKLVLLEQAGAENVVVVNFTREFSMVEPSVFVQQYLIDALGVVVVFTGQGHSFGRNRGGDEHFLTQFPVECCHVDRFENISSTAVRMAIENGDMELASQLLGADYLVITPVVRPPKLLPAAGLYCCSIDGVDCAMEIDEVSCKTQKSNICVKKDAKLEEIQIKTVLL